MRIAFLPSGPTVNSFYRCTGPMLALGRRGHEMRELDAKDSRTWPALLQWCEVLHIHRICDRATVELVRAAKALGAAVVWDDDDDVTQVPKQNVAYREFGGLRGTQRLAARRRLFELVDLVTTPSKFLADAFRAAGAADVRVIENYLPDQRMPAHERHDGVVIGWIAGPEHHLDLELMPLPEVLERLLDAHPQLHVTTIGLGLGLRSDRYRHVKHVPFPKLLHEAAGFDVGIAPLSAQWEINRARSDIKLKEYAAAGVPWLASPIGPYAGMGEQQGGRLVPDERWHEELEALIANPRARRKLAKRATRWAREQMLTGNAHRWEQELAGAIERVGAVD